jgi:hypothetical protein
MQGSITFTFMRFQQADRFKILRKRGSRAFISRCWNVVNMSNILPQIADPDQSLEQAENQATLALSFTDHGRTRPR